LLGIDDHFARGSNIARHRGIALGNDIRDGVFIKIARVGGPDAVIVDEMDLQFLPDGIRIKPMRELQEQLRELQQRDPVDADPFLMILRFYFHGCRDRPRVRVACWPV
jgi:hypothetical protein